MTFALLSVGLVNCDTLSSASFRYQGMGFQAPSFRLRLRPDIFGTQSANADIAYLSYISVQS
jgi:hypothetical protein